MTEAKPSPKVSILTRCMAKAVDLSVVFFANLILPYPVGILLGLVYVLIHDGILQGHSLGKSLFSLRAARTQDHGVCSFRESAIRNAPLGVAAFFGIIPFWGWILLVLIGVPLIALEIYLMLSSPVGARLGDVMAETEVVASSATPLKFNLNRFNDLVHTKVNRFKETRRNR
jgi:hypothetical protein